MAYNKREMVEESYPTVYIVDSGDVRGRLYAVVALAPYGMIVKGHETGLLKYRLSGCNSENPRFLNNNDFCVPFTGPAKDSLSLIARVEDLIMGIPHREVSIEKITTVLEKNNIHKG